ncbi:MAG: alpha-N-acetylglucosaminidase TIM-barrel domain-containing protein, partial [Bacteroidales bacterium]
MKYLTLFLLGVSSLFSYAANYKASKDVISRFAKYKIPLEISSIPKVEQRDNYEIKVEKGIVKIKASSGVAVCRAFYDYTKQNSLGINTWNGSRFIHSDVLPAMEQKTVVSPFKHHYYFNVVTYGYTMPYWDWNRWEKEIDWMALHGIDMPLALVGSEAIMARVWKKLGLTDDEINSYFVAPAHLPWMRMGNLSGVDAPLSKEWHASQIALQHKILKRMKSLDMKPICPAFAGFVPEAMKRLFPDINIVKTSWAGSFHNWMLDPKEELFHTIGVQFIKEWEKEFGKNDYYLADSFNEMEIPFPPVGTKERYELLTSYGDKLYRSIRDANKDAVWVMQGWMFGYTRNIWEPETLKALLSKVPDDKMLLLDLAEDYNHHFWHNGDNWNFYNGFFGKEWVYSVIPNMGGKTAMTGYVDFYANGHLSALTSSKKGNLSGHGLAPEGIENNDMLYELITDAGWSDQIIDTEKWFVDYAKTRYGSVNDSLLSYWGGLRNSVYGSFTDHPRFNWQFRPGRVRKGSVNVNSDFYKAVNSFVSSKGLFEDSELYKVDLIELTAMYVGGKMEILIQAVQDALLLNKIDLAKEQFQLFIHLGESLDHLLAKHPNHRLEYWTNFAQNSSLDPMLKKKYVSNAKRLVTIWGPPIDDYSARLWAGLIKDYYMPRWKHWFDAQINKTTFD